MLNVNEKTLDAYKQKVRAQIKEMKTKMHMLEADVEKNNADMRIKYQKNMSDWKSRFKDVEMKLDKLSNSAEKSWDEIRSGIDTTIEDLRKSIENAKKQINN